MGLKNGSFASRLFETFLLVHFEKKKETYYQHFYFCKCCYVHTVPPSHHHHLTVLTLVRHRGRGSYLHLSRAGYAPRNIRAEQNWDPMPLSWVWVPLPAAPSLARVGWLGLHYSGSGWKVGLFYDPEWPDTHQRVTCPGLLTGQQKRFTVGSKTGMKKTRTLVEEGEATLRFLGDAQPASPHFDLDYRTQCSGHIFRFFLTPYSLIPTDFLNFTSICVLGKLTGQEGLAQFPPIPPEMSN